MKRLLIAFAFGVAGACLLAPSAANAQATRTWVSGVGDDANPCSRTAPCKTFAGAISKTAAAGEIDCIDPGGFGALTITKSIAIKCDYLPEAGVLVSGTNGFVVSAGATDIIWISGLDFEGLGPSALSLNGIKILTAGAVHVSDCTIRGFNSTNGTDGNGIFLNNSGTTKLFVDSTLMADNGLTGLEVKPQAGATGLVQVDRSIASNNVVGMRANGSSNSASINMSINDSTASGQTGAGFNATGGSGPAFLMLRGVTASNNGTGVVAGTNATVRVGYSTISGNTTATVATGTLSSYGNNQINNNTTDTVPTVIPLH